MDILSEANELLLQIYRISMGPGESIDYNEVKNLNKLSFTKTPKDDKHFSFLINDLLKKELGYLVISTFGEINNVNSTIRISSKGLIHISDLLTKKTDSNIGFCAMWFDETVSFIWEQAIKPAISECNFLPIRIDKVHFNSDINAEMISYIQNSKFIVADFTGNRGGVYFEAGFAQGLKIPVIFTCRKDEFQNNKPHFDIEHYNFIIWEPSKIPEFKNKLKDRITISIQ